MNKGSNFIILAILLMIALGACVPAAPTATTLNNTPAGQAPDTTNIVKLNLNTLTGDDLTATIPGFPNRMIREFLEYRPYASIQQFRREIGKYVGDAQVAEYEKYVYVPIAFNDSDSDTLQQIPGLDATKADALIASRPYATQADFLAKLSEVISADEVEIAKTYLGE